MKPCRRVALFAITWTLAWSCGSGSPIHQAGDSPTPPEAASARTRGGPPSRLALLVGIDRYEHARADGALKDLAGCVNDMKRMRALLIDRFEFAPEDVRTLENDQATHQAIVTAFHDHLIRQAGPDTETVFYYAGHGSRVLDGSKVPNAEPDGKDSTFVAYDSRRKGAATCLDVSDDELHSLVRALCARTRRVTVITDSCHAGGVVRGAGTPRIRSAPEGKGPITLETVKAFWPKGVDFVEDGDFRRTEPLPYVHLAACGAREEAGEYEMPDAGGNAISCGAFTFLLAQALEGLAKGSSYGDLVRQVDLKMVSVRQSQEVQGEGELRRLVFGGEFAAPRVGFDASVRSEGKSLLVRAGSSHLVMEGSVFEVRDASGTCLGKADATHVSPIETVATWREPAPRVSRDAPLRAVEVERPAKDPALVVFVPDGSSGDEFAAALRPVTVPRLEVIRSAPATAHCKLVLPEEGGRWELRTLPDELPLWQENRKEGTEDEKDRIAARTATLVEVLETEARYRAILRLADVQGTVRASVKISSASAAEVEELSRNNKEKRFRSVQLIARGARGSAEGATIGVIAVDPDERTVADVGKLEIRFENLTQRMHVVVLSVTEDRAVNVLYPSPATNRSNEVTRENPGIDVKFAVVLDQTWNELRPMRDRFLVIATPQFADFSALERKGSLATIAREERATKRGREDEEKMPRLLQQAIFGATTRGESLSVGGESYGIAAVDLLVTRKGNGERSGQAEGASAEKGR